MKNLVDEALAKRITDDTGLSGFKSKKFDVTSNICECSEGGEDGCLE